MTPFQKTWARGEGVPSSGPIPKQGFFSFPVWLVDTAWETPSQLCHTCLVLSGVKNGKLGETWLRFREMWLLLCTGIPPCGEVSDEDACGRSVCPWVPLRAGMGEGNSPKHGTISSVSQMRLPPSSRKMPGQGACIRIV